MLVLLVSHNSVTNWLCEHPHLGAFVEGNQTSNTASWTIFIDDQLRNLNKFQSKYVRIHMKH